MGAFVWSWSALNAGQMCGLFWGGAFVDSFSVCLSDTILISICALAHWLGFDFRGLKKSAVNGILFRGLHSNCEIMPPMLVRFAFVHFFGGF